MNYKKYFAILLCVIFGTGVMGCQNTAGNISSSTNEGVEVQNEEALEASQDEEKMFTNRDLEVGYVEEDATVISLTDLTVSGQGATSDNSSITIFEEGTYIVRGSASNVQIHVNATADAKIQIVLDNASITNETMSALYVETAKKVFITLASDSKNYFTVSEDMCVSEDTKVDGAIYAKSNLTINGNGTLEIKTQNNGIVTKDDLVISSGSYILETGNHGLEGKDSIRISNGDFSITCKEDALHSDNSEDAEKGFVYISGGNFSISAGDDGIHATSLVTIDGGVIDITKSCEGIEGQNIIVNDGDIRVNSSDDGFNAATGSESSEEGFGNPFASDDTCWIEINGGSIYIKASGDGLDSNGKLVINGGVVYVDGPTNSGNGALDYNGAGVITGGTVIAVGSSGMAQNFETDSTQASILVSTTSNVNGDVVLKNSNGEVILTYSPAKSYNCVVISSPKLQVGDTYTVTMGSVDTEIELTEMIYGNGFAMGGGRGGMFGPGAGGNRGERQDGFKDGQRPQDAERPDSNGENPPELPEGFEPGKDGELPEGFEPPEGMERPDGAELSKPGEQQKGSE